MKTVWDRVDRWMRSPLRKWFSAKPHPPAQQDMAAMEAEVIGHVRERVSAGFDAPSDIVQVTVDHYTGTYDTQDVDRIARAALTKEVAAHLRDQETWPTPTDCERLDAAFASLETQGIVCRQNFTCCQNCGSYEIWDEVESARGSGRSVTGYCFYHMQDADNAVAGGGLFLAYGAVEDRDDAIVAIGRRVVDAVSATGLAVTWDGSVKRRIQVDLNWRRRLNEAEWKKHARA